MITIQIKHGPELEVERVKFTLSKMKWYQENGYNVTIPEGLSEDSLVKDIQMKMGDVYDERDYEEFALTLQNKWKEYISKVEEMYLLEGFHPLKDVYTVVLTRYGTGGSYFPEEGKIIVNCCRARKSDPVGAVFHEMVHMGIEHLIQENSISHWRKERLVDLLCAKYFPEVSFFQEIPEDVSLVDKVFYSEYPNIKDVILKIR